VSNMDGSRLDIAAANIVASNGRLHQGIIETLTDARPEAERSHQDMLRAAESAHGRSANHL
jgi:hypothetical protein